MTSESSVQLVWGACTDRGLRRRTNEDAYLAEAPVFFVADGMGGHEAGDVASHAALRGFAALAGRPRVSTDDVERAFAEAVDAVRSIETDRSAAGTTLAGAALCDHGGVPYWLILNIGDSRVYRWRDAVLEQVSIDHSAVQAMVDRGEIDAAEAERHPQRNVVTRAVGAGSVGAPDYWMLPAQAHDRLMMCSDGLTKELGAEQIGRALAEEAAPRAAAQRLVHEALLHGGRDNVTVIVVDVHGSIDDDDDPTVPGVELDAARDEIDEDTVPRALVAVDVEPVDAGTPGVVMAIATAEGASDAQIQPW
jgi:serine/threonine protein phosphatase PrpC